MELMSSSRAITLCMMNVGFASDHMKHGRLLTTTEIPAPTLDLLTTGATNVVQKANTLSEIMRVAVMDATMLFASLLPFPRAKGACCLQLWT